MPGNFLILKLFEELFDVENIIFNAWSLACVFLLSQGQNIGSENVAQKIIELSKKNREMTAELESSKTKCRQLQSVVQKLETEVSTKLVEKCSYSYRNQRTRTGYESW